MEVSKSGVISELGMPAYATTTAPWDPSHLHLRPIPQLTATPDP